jgi:hypothetical protein
MTNPNNGPDNTGAGAGAGDQGGDGKGEPKFTPVTYKSQEELDAAFSERATRAANSAKQEALKPLLDAGIGVDEALQAYTEKKAEEDAKKEPSTKEREAREKAERELQVYKDKEARDKLSVEVSKEIKIGDTPIPAALLAGTTKEEMTEHGKAIVEFFGQVTGKQGPRPPQHNPLQGANGEDKVSAGDPLRNFLTTGSFQ